MLVDNKQIICRSDCSKRLKTLTTFIIKATKLTLHCTSFQLGHYIMSACGNLNFFVIYVKSILLTKKHDIFKNRLHQTIFIQQSFITRLDEDE